MSQYTRWPVLTSGGGGGGTVTSVAVATPGGLLQVTGSPITTAGTITLSLINEAANLVFAGPTSGGASAPSFRLLVPGDLPTGNLTDAGTDGIVITNGTGAVIGTGTSIAQHVADTTHNGYLSSADWNTFNGKGSVTSVALSSPGVIFSVSGSPVTTSGTLALNLLTQTAHTMLAGPTSGGPATPTFRLLLASDIPSISSGITGILPIANGGTNASTAAAARVSLDIDQRSTFSNANYTVLSTDRYVAQVGVMSAPRVVTLPAASSLNPGQKLVIADESGTVGTTNNLTITAVGGDTIDGSVSKTIRSAYGEADLTSNGTNMWFRPVTGIGSGGTGLGTTPTNGQLLIGNTTTNAYNLNTIAAGPGISITNGAGTIQVNNISVGVGQLSPGLLGDGSDGDVTISVNTTLARDMNYNSLVVNAGITLTTGGFVIFCKTSITVNATGLIVRNGNNGGTAAASAAGAAGAALSGATATTGASGAGAAGGAGTTANGGSGASSAGVTGEGGTGGVGGNGGGGNSGGTVGGSGGNSGVHTARFFRNVQAAWKNTLVGTYMPTGVGGAGGAAGGGDGVNSGMGGGGGGSAGGGLFLLCDSLNNLGTIQTKGGTGGNGGSGALGNVGGGAGGGGGGGGKIMILSNTLTSRGTLDVSGGTAGNGTNGAGTGVPGTAGAAGGAGFATTFEATTATWTTTS